MKKTKAALCGLLMLWSYGAGAHDQDDLLLEIEIWAIDMCLLVMKDREESAVSESDDEFLSRMWESHKVLLDITVKDLLWQVYGLSRESRDVVYKAWVKGCLMEGLQT